mgnify:CR=1 FL=1
MSALLPILGTVLVFMIIGAFFVAAETALITLRDSQVQRLSETHGRRGQRLEKLVKNPNRFLAAGQVGVTFAGFLSAAYGEKRIAPIIVPRLESLGLAQGTAETISFLGSTLVVAYMALVLAELVPKRLGLQHAERYALFLAGPIDVMAKIFTPFIALLSVSTNGVVRLLGGNPKAGKGHISGEELRGMVAAHEDLTAAERELIDDVFEAGDREIREIMIPRTEVAFLDADIPVFKAAKIVADKPHSRYPVSDGSQDDVVGFVHVRDILDPDIRERSIRVGDLARDIARLPGSKQVIPALTDMRAAGAHMAIVVDEYGGTANLNLDRERDIRIGRPAHRRHRRHELVADLAVGTDAVQNFMHSLILDPDHERGVARLQESSGARQFGSAESFADKSVRQTVAVLVLYNGND